jgi:hypothetical protein
MQSHHIWIGSSSDSFHGDNPHKLSSNWASSYALSDGYPAQHVIKAQTRLCYTTKPMCAGMKQGKQAGNYTTKPMCAGRKEGSKQAGKAHKQENGRICISTYYKLEHVVHKKIIC